MFNIRENCEGDMDLPPPMAENERVESLKGLNWVSMVILKFKSAGFCGQLFICSVLKLNVSNFLHFLWRCCFSLCEPNICCVKYTFPWYTLSLGEDKLPLERRWRKSEIVIQNKWRVTHKSLLFQINIASLRIAIATQLTEAFQTFITLIFNWFWCNLFKLSLSFLSFLKKKLVCPEGLGLLNLLFLVWCVIETWWFSVSREIHKNLE